MNQKFSGFKRTAILLAAISAASVPATAGAAWTITDLGTLGGTMSVAYGINDSGQVVGMSYRAGNAAYHAFITGANGAGMIDLDTQDKAFVLGWDVNDAGQLAGHSLTVGNTAGLAFITGANGAGMTDLGTLGGSGSVAYGINNSGQVVGVPGLRAMPLIMPSSPAPTARA